MNTKTASQTWLKRAKDDLRWTEANLKEKVYYGACFTAQQAVEKALKAFLLSQGKEARKIHDIAALLEECGQIDAEFSEMREIILPLVDYYVPTRYPDMTEFMDYDTEEKANDALNRARKLLEFAERKLGVAEETKI